jgi:hypothetical protein
VNLGSLGGIMQTGVGALGAVGGGLGGAIGSGEGAFGLGTEGVGMTGGGYGGAMGAGAEGAGGLGAGLGSSGGGLAELFKQYGPDALKMLGGGGSTNWLSLLGNLGSSWLGSNAAKDASQAQVQAGQDANALAKYIYDQSRADQAPYREAGVGALAGIKGLLANPSSITSMPDYQFQLNEGTKALQNSAAARGMVYSGSQGKALQKYGNDYAGTKLNESYNRLASLAGIGQQATNASGALGANYANNVGQTLTGMGNARGAGTIGSANAWGQGIGNVLNGMQEDDLIAALLKRGGP